MLSCRTPEPEEETDDITADAEAAAGSAPAPPVELPNPDVQDDSVITAPLEDSVPAGPLLPRVAHAMGIQGRSNCSWSLL